MEIPEIRDHPASKTVNLGETVTFEVTVTGEGQCFYEWYKGDVVLQSKRNKLTIANVRRSDAGAYSVMVGNDSGRHYSKVAVLTVNPQIEDKPSSDPVDALRHRLDALVNIEPLLATALVQNAKEYKEHLTSLNKSAGEHTKTFQQSLDGHVERANKFQLWLMLGGIVSIGAFVGWFMSQTRDNVKIMTDGATASISRVQADVDRLSKSASDQIAKAEKEALDKFETKLFAEKLGNRALTIAQEKFEKETEGIFAKDAFIVISGRMAAVAETFRRKSREPRQSDGGVSEDPGARALFANFEMKRLTETYAEPLAKGVLNSKRASALGSAVNGLVATVEGELDDARKWFRLSIETDPSFSEGYCLLASSFYTELHFNSNKGWVPEKDRLRTLEVIHQLRSPECEHHLTNAVVRQLMVVVPALEIRPGDMANAVKVTNQLCDTIDQGLELASELESTYPGNRPVDDLSLCRLYSTIAARYSDLIDYTNSARIYTNADDLIATNAVYRRNAIEYFRRSFEQDSSHYIAQNNLIWFVTHDGPQTALIQTNQDKWQLSESELRKLVHKFLMTPRANSSSRVLDTVAEAYYALGEREEAKKLATKVVELARKENWTLNGWSKEPSTEVEEREKWSKAIAEGTLAEFQKAD
jgi:tetratricopeptide (TPR) repeat protein